VAELLPDLSDIHAGGRAVHLNSAKMMAMDGHRGDADLVGSQQRSCALVARLSPLSTYESSSSGSLSILLI
jgi:hypothetical protein